VKTHTMDLELAIVSQCADDEYQVHLLDSEAGSVDSITTHRSTPMIEHNITVLPEHLVAVDKSVEPPQILFRWGCEEVTRIEGEHIFAEKSCGGDRFLTLIEGLDVTVKPGDEVYIAFGKVYDICIDGRPAHPKHLRARSFPQIQEMYRKMQAAEEIDPKQIIADGYDRIAEKHLEWAQSVRAAEREHYTSVILERVPKGAKVLDLGCGAGAPTTHALAGRFEVTGVDISARQIALAQQNIPEAKFIQTDMTQLDFDPESFDAVATFYALIHVPRQEQSELLQNIATWLRPGGLLVATMGARSMKADLDELLGAPMYWSGFDSATNRQLVEEAGLHIISAKEETAEEFGKPVTFLWVVAQKPDLRD
jgi:2-polyprenyl-3-methyl-5-hydroxy-6-metoxy-1,4-benzoquinol methylase